MSQRLLGNNYIVTPNKKSCNLFKTINYFFKMTTSQINTAVDPLTIKLYAFELFVKVDSRFVPV